MTTVREKKPAAVKNGRAGTTSELWQVLKTSGVVDILYLTAAVSIFGFQFNVLMPVIVGSVLHGQAQQLGLLTAAVGAGSLIGSLTIASSGHSKSIKRAIGFAMLGLSLGVFAVGWSSVMWLSLIAVAIAGFSISLQLSGANFTIQMSVPEDVRGRVMGIYSFFMVGLAPFGALMAGLFAHVLGVQIALFIAASTCALAGIVYLKRAPAASSPE